MSMTLKNSLFVSKPPALILKFFDLNVIFAKFASDSETKMTR